MKKGKGLSWDDLFRVARSKDNLNYFGITGPKGTSLHLLKPARPRQL
ncbi:MAG: hypothetical protein AABX01_08080 [Candidatus Micrarchaeota archaeon]